MKTKIITTIVLLSISFGAIANVNLKDFVVKILEPIDKRVVIQSPSGEVKVYKSGDVLTGTSISIVEILTSKLMLEESVVDESGNKIKRKVIMFLEKNGQSKIERLYIVDRTNKKSWVSSKTSSTIMIKPIKKTDKK